MCNYDGPMILTLFNDLKGSQSLTETHLGVPQHHLTAAVEFGNSLIDGQLLFRAEFNYLMNRDYLAGADCTTPFLDCLNSLQSSLNAAFKPLPALILLAEIVALDTGTQQDIMNLFVIKRGNKSTFD